MNERELEVKQVIDTLRPAMETDGGGVDLVSVQDGIVHVKFRGACLLCPSIGLTLRIGIEKTLKDKLRWVREVVQTEQYPDQ
ncbi:MAG: NifU family protein [Ignavibacteriae bacterium]|nr:NifU family protein [Ignavibacteria bacterium]MBI3364254.1 NifU family protein [Ignavibacteriota bacterium]